MGDVWSFRASASGNIYYVDADRGIDINVGDITNPWATLSKSIPELQPGDMLYVRDGTYYESDIEINIIGTDSHHIVIKNFQNEAPVIDGGYKEFRTVPNADWEIHDEARKIYRSVRKYSDSGIVHGYVKTGSGYSHGRRCC
ncbi:MAG: hypothetical protein JSW20_06830 [Nitrospiraceae bacterium]|nr:MAG: hypothetical protein JSW20_06830 [Nitrospiraceae bacterium]